MVASRASMKETPDSIVVEMSDHMRALAAEGDWAEVESLAVRLRSAVLNVPESRRRSALAVVRRATESVVAEAETARREVTEKLSALRRGRAATRAYESR